MISSYLGLESRLPIPLVPSALNGAGAGNWRGIVGPSSFSDSDKSIVASEEKLTSCFTGVLFFGCSDPGDVGP